MGNKLNGKDKGILAAITIAACTQCAIVSIATFGMLGYYSKNIAPKNYEIIETINTTTAVFSIASLSGVAISVASFYVYLKLRPSTWWPRTEEQPIIVGMQSLRGAFNA